MNSYKVDIYDSNFKIHADVQAGSLPRCILSAKQIFKDKFPGTDEKDIHISLCLSDVHNHVDEICQILSSKSRCVKNLFYNMWR